MTIGTKIRKIRELKDLTQEDFARALGCSQDAISKIERGQTDPVFSKVVRIAEILKIDLTSLANFDEQQVLGENPTRIQRESNENPTRIQSFARK